MSLDRQTDVRPSPLTSALPGIPEEISDDCFSSFPENKKRRNLFSVAKKKVIKTTCGQTVKIVCTQTEIGNFNDFEQLLAKGKAKMSMEDAFPLLCNLTHFFLCLLCSKFYHNNSQQMNVCILHFFPDFSPQWRCVIH